MKLVHFGDSYFREYSPSEAMELFKSLEEKVFLRDDDPLFLRKDARARVFKHPDWRTIAVGENPWFGNPTSWVPDDAPEGCVQLSRDGKKWHYTMPLLHALAERGTDEIVHIASWPGEPPERRFEGGAITSQPIANFSYVMAQVEPILVAGQGCMFSREGDWGLYGDLEEGCVIGGEPAFMARVIELGGGEEFLKKIYDEYWMEKYWRLEPTYRDYILQLYGYANWEPPREIVEWEPS